MIALLLAAQMAAAQPVPHEPLKTVPDRGYSYKPVDRNCANARSMALIDYPNAGQAVANPPARKLGDLPRAHMEYAVERSIDGCVKPAVVRYDVEQRSVTRAGAPASTR